MACAPVGPSIHPSVSIHPFISGHKFPTQEGFTFHYDVSFFSPIFFCCFVFFFSLPFPDTVCVCVCARCVLGRAGSPRPRPICQPCNCMFVIHTSSSGSQVGVVGWWVAPRETDIFRNKCPSSSSSSSSFLFQGFVFYFLVFPSTFVIAPPTKPSSTWRVRLLLPTPPPPPLALTQSISYKNSHF